MFRSARTSCTTFGWSRPIRAKNLDHLYTGIYALWIIERLTKPTLWSHGIPWMPSRPPGTPWQPPNRPPQTHKQVSWPHCTLMITSTASQITFTFIPVTPVTPSSSSPPSPPSPPLSWPWDLETLRPWDLETLRPWDLESLRPWDLSLQSPG